jgi:hypothetical protein
LDHLRFEKMGTVNCPALSVKWFLVVLEAKIKPLTGRQMQKTISQIRAELFPEVLENNVQRLFC